MRRGRLRRSGGAALLAVALLVTACGGSGAGGPSVTASAGPPTASTTPTTASLGTPADRLTAALGAMAAGYTFDTSVTVAGKVATHVSGRWVGGGSEFVVESGGQSVTYRTLPPHAWVLKPGSDWVQVDGQLAGGAPLDALTKPQGTTVASDGPDGLVIDAAYPATALGLAGTAPVTVRMTLAKDGSVTATYTTDTTAGKAESTTILKPAAGEAPIVAPSAAPSPTSG